MLVIDTSEAPTDLGLLAISDRAEDIRIFGDGRSIDMVHIPWSKSLKPTIGMLRNSAVAWLKSVRGIDVDLFVHFDDDDYSHPNRIAEQVALLQSTGADVVGFNEMLFWREPEPLRYLDQGKVPTKRPQGEAWLYINRNPTYALGTSLCYWRRTWERKPFEATNYGEDHKFCSGLKVLGTNSFNTQQFTDQQPRMIARIHAGNTAKSAYTPEHMRRHPEHWKRVPAWDAYCLETMK